MNVRLVGVTAVAALALIALPGTAGTAQAATGSAGHGGHCVLDLTGQARVSCFDTFSGAIAHATGGAVRLPAGATQVEGRYLAQLRQANAAAPSQVAIGTLYNDADRRGHSWTITRASDCDTDPDVDWTYTNLSGVKDGSGFDWNDEIGSAVQYGQCQAVYYEHSYFRGASVSGDWSGGALDDEVSSIAWS
ncbi:hypothetical protein [Streptomyces galbus]|uniref:Secreted protein n=1 Tax=Streptomyces galbus TaxID=33898 RepID=A0A4U5W6D4_STRGB|nr:hypothetical protein [Streptomyces galbus]TKS97083.1 hypothetical protein E4U92_33605 [Streptomyces galbus]GHD49832.1 hypothetical protein GCM10010335_59840 [Streptomyces galbus]